MRQHGAAVGGGQSVVADPLVLGDRRGARHGAIVRGVGLTDVETELAVVVLAEALDDAALVEQNHGDLHVDVPSIDEHDLSRAYSLLKNS